MTASAFQQRFGEKLGVQLTLINGHSALYLPHVWRNHPEWTFEMLLKELTLKTGATDENYWQTRTVDATEEKKDDNPHKFSRIQLFKTRDIFASV